MSSTVPGGPADRRTPIYDQTITSMHVEDAQLDRTDDPDGSADGAKQAAGQAKDTAKQAAGQAADQAKQVGSTAADAGKRVASTTKDEASRVATDAVGQAKQLYGQATDQLSEQAGKQQQHAASALRTLGDDLSSMHEQHDGGGLAAELVQNLARRASRAAEWLDDREPEQVLDEVKQFAARRPGLFIGLALVTGIVAARASKALVANARSDDEPESDGAGSGRTERVADDRTAPITNRSDVRSGAGWSSEDALRAAGSRA